MNVLYTKNKLTHPSYHVDNDIICLTTLTVIEPFIKILKLRGK